MKNAPIGIFDSGLGGLTVYSAIHKAMPHESLVYLGDTARLPYGNKSSETVIKYSLQNAAFLKSKGVKLIVIACNTSSAYSIPALKKEFDIPIIGVIEPGVLTALKATTNGHVGVIGTQGTIMSQAYSKLLKHHNAKVRVTSQACPLFVPLVEEGWLDDPVTLEIARKYLADIQSEGVDTLILGCTHYPLLKGVIADAVGANLKLVDSAAAVAETVKEMLISLGTHSDKKAPLEQLYVTDMPQRFEEIASRFLGRKIPKVRVVEF